MGPNPNGVAALRPRMMNNEMSRLCVAANAGRNPVGVAESASASPRVAEYTNPGLRTATPFGVATTRL